ncbi:MAG TPA: hypothetical protein VFO89_15940 [Thermoanaerobaculia bacterium]|nr:hypothetical protein [Thermoanaerobaculia bacterium]
MTPYAVATLEELWSYDRLVERRLSHGVAEGDGRGGIVAGDARDETLVAACESAMFDVRHRCLALHRRIVVEATHGGVSATIILRDAGQSIVTSPEHFAHDHELIRSIASIPVEAPAMADPPLPVLWRHGSAAVLLHEAIGHPLEHGKESVRWPEWLEVDVPLAERRASFRDLPLRRMLSLTARQNGAAMDLPERRVEVLLVDGGHYEPLTDRITLRISAADLVEGEISRRLPPFTIVRTREELARSIAGAAGDPVRYPGVICSREGQELFVPSSAPILLTVLA